MTAPIILADPSLRPQSNILRSRLGSRPRFVPLSETEQINGLAKAALRKKQDLKIVFRGVFPQPGSPAPQALHVLTIPEEALSNLLEGAVKVTGAQLAAAGISRFLGGLSQTETEAANGFLRQWQAVKPDPWYASPDRTGTGANGQGTEDVSDLGAVLHGLMSGGSQMPKGVSVAFENAGMALDLCAARLMEAGTLWVSPYDQSDMAAAEALECIDVLQGAYQRNAQRCFCVGAQKWNHPAINATFAGRAGPVTFCDTPEAAIDAARKAEGSILSWASKTTPELEAASAAAQVPLFRIEDGFLRSVGLGAGLARGASLALDDLGIYYDPSRPSRLERLLQTYDLTQEERERAETLRDLIISHRVSKYNFGKNRHLDLPEEKEIVLVVGQVADDAAVRKSMSATIDCRGTENVNWDLLKLARKRHPDAFIIYKPHPDVETGLRKGRLDEAAALQHADLIAKRANVIDLIDVCDRLETFSSLAGFEALIRGKPVTTHGMPFYAGWGLSEDLTENPNRGRLRPIEDLLFLALVKYSRTIDPVTLLPCSPEFLITRLTRQRASLFHHLITTAKREISWLGRKLGI